ncbi:MAG: outer membrane protein assembly factor [Bacteroidales bacterium]|nr:outer membrane protein assembly factor [Bacteroidales bacterium]
MKNSRLFAAAALLALTAVSIPAGALGKKKDKDMVKTGWNIGPLPVVAYDADKGFQVGAILQLFNYGDGSNYPNYDSKLYFEYSYFTKGSMLGQIMYDEKELIPGVRWSSAMSISYDKGCDFFGFNGYQNNYDWNAVACGKKSQEYHNIMMLPGQNSTGIFTPFYKFSRLNILLKTDFVGRITDHLKWEVGYHASYFKTGAIDYANINKGKKPEQIFPSAGENGYSGTLFEKYVDWGLISENEAGGGFSSSIRAGLMFDTRDKEGAPTRGIWAEGHVMAAPKWLGTRNPFYRYSVTFRQYVPIVKNDVLTFAYRLNYEGAFGNSSPYYVLPFITVMGENGDKEGMGGYRTTRGIMRHRVVGLDMFTYTAELRYRFIKFKWINQNMSFAFNIFSDGTMVTRGRDMSYNGKDDAALRAEYEKYITAAPKAKDTIHPTVGAGLRFIMNENFIVAFEYGMPVTHLMKKDNPLYNQDGTGAFYVNIGYLF